MTSWEELLVITIFKISMGIFNIYFKEKVTKRVSKKVMTSKSSNDADYRGEIDGWKEQLSFVVKSFIWTEGRLEQTPSRH